MVRIVLQDAHYTIVTPGRNARTWLNLTADKQSLVIPMESPVEKLSELRRTYLTRSELNERSAELRGRLAVATVKGERESLQARLSLTLTEIHLRQALAFSTLVLSLVGVPLGIWTRRESKLASFAVAVLVFLVLYALIAGGEGMAIKRRMAPALALWAPDILTAALGVGLLLNRFRR